MEELELFGQTYRVGKLDAMKQFHVARRVAPIVAALGVSISELVAAGQVGDEVDLTKVAGPIADIVSKMSDEETEYVIRVSLAVVQRRVEVNGQVKWSSVQTGAHLQFADMTMQVMIRLVVEVLKANLGGFFGMPTAGSPSDQN